MEITSLGIAILALLVAGGTFYCQFFRKKQHLFINFTWPQQKKGPCDFLAVLTNGGDLSCVVCTLDLSYVFSETTQGGKYMRPAVAMEIDNEKMQLSPGEHLRINFRLPRQVPVERLREAKRKDEGPGIFTYCLPIRLYVEFIDSFGRKIMRPVDAGEQHFDASGTANGIQIRSRTMDLVNGKEC
jgi:hypothetical protein